MVDAPHLPLKEDAADLTFRGASRQITPNPHRSLPQTGSGRQRGQENGKSMIRKSGNRFSEMIMLKQRDEIMMRFHLIAS
jgi:hypothetical protein